MRILAFVFGVILLAPGACALTFMAMGITALPPIGSAEWGDPEIWGFIAFALFGWGICFLISWGGIVLIRNAINPPPANPNEPPSA